MENIWVRDTEDLLDGYLLAPMRIGENHEEVDEEYTGRVWEQERHHRIVYISGGMMNRSYGGPEEGGWWYDAFDPQVEFCLSVNDEETLRQAISHVEALLRLRNPYAENRDLEIIIQTGDFFQQHRPHYE